jgi:hypothetical protein
VVRGGSWNNNQDNARAAYRNRNHPSNRNNNIGFRVVGVSAMFFRPSYGGHTFGVAATRMAWQRDLAGSKMASRLRLRG